MKKTFFGGDTGAVNCRKKGLEQCPDLKGGLAKKKKRKDDVFEVTGVETAMHTMSWRSLLIDTNIQNK